LKKVYGLDAVKKGKRGRASVISSRGERGRTFVPGVPSGDFDNGRSRNS